MFEAFFFSNPSIKDKTVGPKRVRSEGFNCNPIGKSTAAESNGTSKCEQYYSFTVPVNR